MEYAYIYCYKKSETDEHEFSLNDVKTEYESKLTGNIKQGELFEDIKFFEEYFNTPVERFDQDGAIAYKVKLSDMIKEIRDHRIESKDRYNNVYFLSDDGLIDEPEFKLHNLDFSKSILITDSFLVERKIDSVGV
jgi:hypothetical protein